MKIVNLGSLNIDRTYRVDHLAKAKETVKAKKYEEFCGGKGLNQSIALAKAGADVYHAGYVGEDGLMLLKALRKEGVKTEYIRKSKNPSGHAIIQVDDEGQNCIVFYGGANDDVSPDYVDELLQHFGAGDMLLLQNETSGVGYAIEKAREKNIKVALNPSPLNEAIGSFDFQKVNYLILNEVEGKTLSGAVTEEPTEIMQKLRTKFPEAAIVLTLGEGGAYYLDEKRTIYQKIFRTTVKDTAGAGDTFTGYFLAGIVAGQKPEKAMKYASLASSISVSRRGTSVSIPCFAEVQERLRIVN